MRLFTSLSGFFSLSLTLTSSFVIGTAHHASAADGPTGNETQGDVIVVTDLDDAPKTDPTDKTKPTLSKPAPPAQVSDRETKKVSSGETDRVSSGETDRVSSGETDRVSSGETDKATHPAPTTATASDQPTTQQASITKDVEAAALKGIQPGTSTTKQLVESWGKPLQTEPVDGTTQYVYAIAGFKRVEVYTQNDIVKYVLVVFNQAFPPNAVAEQLKFDNLQPVKIYDDFGRPLGQAYPDRGVALSYDAGKNPPTVSQILMEPISAESFVARAEQRWKAAHDAALKDVNIAIHLEAGHARAHWLRAQILEATGKIDDAVAAISEAVRLAPTEAEFRLTQAHILSRTGDFKRAFAETDKVANSLPATSHIKALAVDQLGDLIAASPRPNYKQALKFHMEAIQIADGLATNPKIAVRRTAKQVLFDAHLAAANDICWGSWKKKDAVVPKWLGQASTAAEDLILKEGASEELRFELARRTLAAYAGAAGLMDESDVVNRLQLASKRLTSASTDASYRERIQWETAQGLYQALVNAHSRSAIREGKSYAQAALLAYHQGTKQRQQTTQLQHFVGRLYFRTGALHAVLAKDHDAAIDWYAKAIPILEQPVPDSVATDGAKQGEAFISMGVSYWEAGQHLQAVKLTTEGVHLFEKAVSQGLIQKSQLEIPYNNLASMHHELGDAGKSKEFAEMATRLKIETKPTETQRK